MKEAVGNALVAFIEALGLDFPDAISDWGQELKLSFT